MVNLFKTYSPEQIEAIIYEEMKHKRLLQSFTNGTIVIIRGNESFVKGVIIDTSDENYVQIQLIDIPYKVWISRELLLKDNEKLQTISSRRPS